jgi:hypothetical protein
MTLFCGTVDTPDGGGYTSYKVENDGQDSQTRLAKVESGMISKKCWMKMGMAPMQQFRCLFRQPGTSGMSRCGSLQWCPDPGISHEVGWPK